MPGLNNKSHMNGFMLGSQKLMARTAAERARKPKHPDRGSWWADCPRDQWGEKCAEVFLDVNASVEGQKTKREWRT